MNIFVAAEVTKLLRNHFPTLQDSEFNATQLLRFLDHRIGSLSRTDKMPGWSWGISPHRCITGSRLVRHPDTVCSRCYAMRGHYRFPVVEAAMERRYAGWDGELDWVRLIAAQILLRQKGEGWFRWFDSGDLQSETMMHQIDRVAMLTPSIRHWVSTREGRLLRNLPDPFFAPNLTVRVSMHHINSRVSHSNRPVSVVTTKPHKSAYACPAHEQGGRCGSCRACWDRDIPLISYPLRYGAGYDKDELRRRIERSRLQGAATAPGRDQKHRAEENTRA